MKQSDTPISHVTDTAYWVATFRANESKRPDALFHDPLAERLVGDMGEKIASRMSMSRLVAWSVVIRTTVIDRYIRELVAQGVDLVVNLGAGLDTRPYRMELPSALRWVEVDYESTVRYKEEVLAGEKPRCRLERIALDLADPAARARLFPELGASARKVLILTEGVIPYLSEDDVAALGRELRAQASFRYWIVEYFDPRLYRYFKNRKRLRQMRNAPFRFMPKDWYGTFDQTGWKPAITRYLPEESERLGRKMPMPWWAAFLSRFMGAKVAERSRRISGYALLEPKR